MPDNVIAQMFLENGRWLYLALGVAAFSLIGYLVVRVGLGLVSKDQPVEYVDRWVYEATQAMRGIYQLLDRLGWTIATVIMSAYSCALYYTNGRSTWGFWVLLVVLVLTCLVELGVLAQRRIEDMPSYRYSLDRMIEAKKDLRAHNWGSFQGLLWIGLVNAGVVFVLALIRQSIING